MHRDVSVPRGGFHLAGQLHLPDDVDASRTYPAIVLSTPGSSVKEQIGATYAARLAAHGFVALTVDPAFQGQSGGEPRDLESPYERAEDLRCAVDFLVGLDSVAADRIGVLGVCAGGGYAVHTAATEHRFRAVSTVVPVDIGRASREGRTSPGGVLETLVELGEQRSAEARGGAEARAPWLPDTPQQAADAGIVDVDVLEAVRYYRTPRGHDPHSTNRRLLRSDTLLLGFDAFHLADVLLTQPLQVVVGGRIGSTGSYADGRRLWATAANPRSFHVVEGAGHYELYDEPAHVDEAVREIAAFFGTHLAA